MTPQFAPPDCRGLLQCIFSPLSQESSQSSKLLLKYITAISFLHRLNMSHGIFSVFTDPRRDPALRLIAALFAPEGGSIFIDEGWPFVQNNDRDAATEAELDSVNFIAEPFICAIDIARNGEKNFLGHGRMSEQDSFL